MDGQRSAHPPDPQRVYRADLADTLGLRVECLRLVVPADAGVTDRTAGGSTTRPRVPGSQRPPGVPPGRSRPPGRRLRTASRRVASGADCFCGQRLRINGLLTAAGRDRAVRLAAPLKPRPGHRRRVDALLRSARSPIRSCSPELPSIPVILLIPELRESPGTKFVATAAFKLLRRSPSCVCHWSRPSTIGPSPRSRRPLPAGHYIIDIEQHAAVLEVGASEYLVEDSIDDRDA